MYFMFMDKYFTKNSHKSLKLTQENILNANLRYIIPE